MAVFGVKMRWVVGRVCVESIRALECNVLPALIFTATTAMVVASSKNSIVRRVPPHSSPVFM